MRLAIAMVGLVSMFSEAFGAEPTATNFARAGGRLMVAQSYCAMCRDERTHCVIKCNGSGACIQSCDDDYRLCVERACGRKQ
jgi:hypothetical protein